MNFTLQPVDSYFFTRAPKVLKASVELNQSVEQVWDKLTRDGGMEWVPGLKGPRWTSPKPFGVGTTRTVAMAGGLIKVKERYFHWEESPTRCQKSFYVESSSGPGLQALAEDYIVEATPNGCRFTWVLALEGPLVKLLPSFADRFSSGLIAKLMKKI
jgi:hypothetical protein